MQIIFWAYIMGSVIYIAFLAYQMATNRFFEFHPLMIVAVFTWPIFLVGLVIIMLFDW